MQIRRSDATTFLATLAIAAAALMACGAPANASAPEVVIGGVPAANKQSGTFTFVSDPGAELRCSLDGGQFRTCASPAAVGPLAAGPHTFGVFATGSDGQEGPVATYAWVIDLTPPPIPLAESPADVAITNVAVPRFSGTAEPGARVAILDGVDQLVAVVAAADGAWSWTPPSPLADGIHGWRLRASDPAGNLSPYSAMRTLTVDTVAPTAPTVTSPAENAKTNRPSPDFEGAGEPGATVVVMDGTTELCRALVAAAGSWSCGSKLELTDGVWSVAARATDAAGNTSDAVARAFSIDSVPPVPPTLDVPAGAPATQATDLSISGTGDPGAPIAVYFAESESAQTVVEDDGSWNVYFTAIAEGDYEITATQFDDHGNQSVRSNPVSLRVDRTAPVVAFVEHPGQWSRSTSAHFAFSTGDPVVDYECALDGAAWSTCDASSDVITSGEGEHELLVRATDAAGNAGGESGFAWTVDLSPPPAPSISEPVSGATVASDRPQIVGSAEPDSTVELIVDGSPVGRSAPVGSDGQWRLSPDRDLDDGLRQVSAVAIDRAGNSSVASVGVELQVDTTAPQITLIDPPVGTLGVRRVELGFTVDDPSATVECALDGGSFSACTSAFESGELGEGPHHIALRAVDPAGNSSPSSTIAYFTLDHTPPAGRSAQIAGTGDAGVAPSFRIESDDPGAELSCRIDNSAFAQCSSPFVPSGAGPGLHVLTVRYRDQAGNESDQVIAFSVGADTRAALAPAAPACRMLGAPGAAAADLSLSSVTGRGRRLIVTGRTRRSGLVRLRVTQGRARLAQLDFVAHRGRFRASLALRHALTSAGRPRLAASFFTVARSFGTLSLELSISTGHLAPAPGARAVVGADCPSVRESTMRPRLAAGGSAGASDVSLRLRRGGPLIAAVTLTHDASGREVARTLIVLDRAGRAARIPLARGRKLERGRYRLSYRALTAGASEVKGSLRLTVR